jgi:hypothetical protein
MAYQAGLFVSKVDKLIETRQHIFAEHIIVRGLMVRLCDEMSKLVDAKVKFPGPETLKLSNALADYRGAEDLER